MKKNMSVRLTPIYHTTTRDRPIALDLVSDPTIMVTIIIIRNIIINHIQTLFSFKH
jgi:hypothetical protein